MKNLFRAAVCFVILFFGVTFVEFTSAADHTHFNTEKEKPGVVYSKAFRSTADAQQDYNSNDGIPFGSPGSAYYDDNLDGTFLPIQYPVSRNGISYENVRIGFYMRRR